MQANPVPTNSGEETENTIYVYPNPNDGSFYIVIDAFKSEELSVNVVDLLGKNVYSKMIMNENGIAQITLPSNIGSGIYTVQIAGTKKTQTTRIIKK